MADHRPGRSSTWCAPTNPVRIRDWRCADPSQGRVGAASRFDRREVERLALRGRPREASRSRSLGIGIETSITDIVDHTIRLRGYDVMELAWTATFEMVAELIWTGTLPETSPLCSGSTIDRCRGGSWRLLRARRGDGDRPGATIDRDAR
jgi:hypothetical protein